MEGKKASVAIYAHLAKAHNGKLNKASAAEGVELYAEKAEEARQHAGSHPNIDLLFRVIAENATYDIVVDAS